MSRSRPTQKVTETVSVKSDFAEDKLFLKSSNLKLFWLWKRKFGRHLEDQWKVYENVPKTKRELFQRATPPKEFFVNPARQFQVGGWNLAGNAIMNRPTKKKVSESHPWKDTGSQPFLSDAAIIRLFQWPCEDLGPICYQINEKWFCGRSMPAMTCHKSQSPNRSTPHGQRLIKIPPPNGNPRRLKENVKTRPGSRTLTQQTDAWNYKLVEVGWPSGTRSGGSGIECLHCTGPIVEY